MHRFAGPLFAAVLAAFPSLALAGEGMYPYHEAPVELVHKEFGVSLTPDWLDDVRLSSVRLNDGGSGAFVSADGLVLTNHHVALEQLGKQSTPELDYVQHGFYAPTREKEIPVKDLEMNVLVSMENVTDRVLAAIPAGAATGEANELRKAEISRIEKESFDATQLRSDVVSLRAGSEYWLYRYKKYTDIRLVMAPEAAAASFGTDFDNSNVPDHDNFSYPRFALDFAFFRVYENGAPVHADHYLRWSENGAKENELVFTSGHPGQTDRLKTLAQLEFIREHELPAMIEARESQKGALLEYSQLGPEQSRQATPELHSLNNGLKRLYARQEGIQDPKLWKDKAEEEAAMRAAVASEPETLAAFDRLASAKKEQASRYDEQLAFAALRSSELASIAHSIVQYAAETAKPNDQRYPEFRDTALDSLKVKLFSSAPIYAEMEKRQLKAGLQLALKRLGREHPLLNGLTDDRTIEREAARLVDGTRLADPEFRKALVAGGQAAIDASDDPLIVFFRRMSPHYKGWRKWFEDTVESVETMAGRLAAQARAKAFGKSKAPDGNFTLRLSYGVVRGYEQLMTAVPAFTTFYGLFDRASAFAGRRPFTLSDRLRKAVRRIRMATHLNMVTDNDTVGGNSGSPVVNAAKELVGLVFDGNIQKQPNAYSFIHEPARVISVTSEAIFEALWKVYGARELVRELSESQYQRRMARQRSKSGGAAAEGGAGPTVRAFSSVVEGDVEINDKATLKRFAETVTEVHGDIGINIFDRGDDERLDLVLPKLERVTGGFVFGGAMLRSLDMPNLAEVGGNMFISMASYPQPQLISVKLPRLKKLSGTLIDISNASPSLTRADVDIRDADVRAKIRPESLR